MSKQTIKIGKYDVVIEHHTLNDVLEITVLDELGEMIESLTIEDDNDDEESKSSFDFDINLN